MSCPLGEIDWRGFMLNKVAGLARAIAILIAIVAAFVPALPAQVPLVLLLLGIVAGFGYGDGDFTRVVVVALGLGIAGPAMLAIPQIGGYLAAIFGGVGIAVAGIIATRIIIRLYELVVGDLKNLAN